MDGVYEERERGRLEMKNGTTSTATDKRRRGTGRNKGTATEISSPWPQSTDDRLSGITELRTSISLQVIPMFSFDLF